MCIYLAIANQTRKFVPGDICADVAPAQCNDDDQYVMLKDATTVLDDIRKSLVQSKDDPFLTANYIYDRALPELLSFLGDLGLMC